MGIPMKRYGADLLRCNGTEKPARSLLNPILIHESLSGLIGCAVLRNLSGSISIHTTL